MRDGKVLQEKRFQRELGRPDTKEGEEGRTARKVKFVHTCASLIASGFNN